MLLIRVLASLTAVVLLMWIGVRLAASRGVGTKLPGGDLTVLGRVVLAKDTTAISLRYRGTDLLVATSPQGVAVLHTERCEYPVGAVTTLEAAEPETAESTTRRTAHQPGEPPVPPAPSTGNLANTHHVPAQRTPHHDTASTERPPLPQTWHEALEALREKTVRR